MNAFSFLLGAAVAAGAMTARAQAPDGTKRIAPEKPENPCVDDRRRFCSGAQSDAVLRECMRKHSAQLSSACREHRSKSAPVSPEGEACKPDIRKFCPDAKRFTAVFDCLQKHKHELSPACRANSTNSQPCLVDGADYCSGVRGLKEIRRCLLAHKEKLSAGCRDSLIDPAAPVKSESGLRW